MACGCAHIPTSLSSTTTSDPHRRRNPGFTRIRGFALLGEARSGRIPGIPQEIRSRCRLMPIRESAQPHLGGDPEFAWPSWLTASRTT